MGRFVNRYTPLSLACAVVLMPVASFAAPTDAFGMAAPLASKTVPVKSPLMACARALPEQKAKQKASRTGHLLRKRRSVMISPLFRNSDDFSRPTWARSLHHTYRVNRPSQQRLVAEEKICARCPQSDSATPNYTRSSTLREYWN